MTMNMVFATLCLKRNKEAETDKRDMPVSERHTDCTGQAENETNTGFQIFKMQNIRDDNDFHP